MTSVAGDGTRRKTACVTGGDGYIASALVKMLLRKGYAVKTTVRKSDDMEKHPHLKDLQGLGPLQVFRADLEDEGSFDYAVAGCDYAFLVASPMNLNAENPEIFVAEEEAASGRYICCCLNTTVAELATFLAAKYPQYNVKTDRFGSCPEKPRVSISSAKLIGESFEFRYKALDEICDDVID